MRGWVIAALLAAGVAGAGLGMGSCQKKPAQATTAPGGVILWPTPVNVVVSIPPLKGLVLPLLPPGSKVTVLIPPGVSEHGYEIPPTQIKEAINADLLVWIGGMEPAVDTLSKENQRANRADLRLADVLGIEVHDDDDHDHGKGVEHHEHEHGAGGEGDPHVWLDPQKAKLIAISVAAQVDRLRPQSLGGPEAAAANAAYKAQFVALDDLDKAYKDGLAGAKNRTIVVGHDAYGWLARRYDLHTVAISGLSAGEPTPGDLQKAKETVRANGLKAIFKERQLSDAAAQSIAKETGAQVLTLDPLGDGDYFKMMRENLAAIRKALGLEPVEGAGTDGK